MAITPVALITGSGKKRVGAAVAEALARKGYSIALHYRTSAREAEETADNLLSLGVEAVAFQADLADDSAVKSLVEARCQYCHAAQAPALDTYAYLEAQITHAFGEALVLGILPAGTLDLAFDLVLRFPNRAAAKPRSSCVCLAQAARGKKPRLC